MPRSARALAAGLLVTLFAACGSTSPTPAPSAAAPTTAASPAASQAAQASASPSAAPSASAAAPSPSASAGPDVAAAFSKAVSDKLFRPHIVVKSVATVAGQTIAMQGTVDVNYGVSRSTTVTLAAGKRTTEDKISTDTKEYTKKFGQWFETPKTGSGSDFAKILSSGGGFTDAGLDTRDGVSLHHLTLTDSSKITGTDVGLPAAVAATAKVTIEGWADDSGTPKAMRVSATWDQPLSGGGTTPAQVAIDMTFDGSAATVLEPSGDSLWVMRTSKYFKYAVGVPSGWIFSAGNKKYYDMFDSYNGADFQVGGYPAKGWTTNSYSAYLIKHPAEFATKITKAHATSSHAGRVAGQPARIFTIWGTQKGHVWYHQIAVTSYKGKVWVLFLGTERKPTAEDVAMFTSFLSSFSFK